MKKKNTTKKPVKKVVKTFLGSELTDGKLTKLVISREQWGWGALLSSASLGGGYCCLGFMSRACGTPKNKLLDLAMPSGLDKNCCSFPEWLLDENGVDSEDAYELSNINDDSNMPQAEKEEKITEICAKHGVKVVFVP